ncbi:MAG: hypothetical protein ABSH51_06955 [Solirubrobacteraceae bacterium]|jgi:hypothetical protein
MIGTDRLSPTILACRRAGLPVIGEHDCTCHLAGQLIVFAGPDGLRIFWPCDVRCPVHVAAAVTAPGRLGKVGRASPGLWAAPEVSATRSGGAAR